MGGKSKQKKVGQEPSAETIVVVLPGDDVTERILSANDNNKLPKLGLGLQYNPNTRRVKVTLAGRLDENHSTKTWLVWQNAKRYLPAVEDRVLVVVEERIGSDGSGGDLFRVNMHGPHPGTLSNLDFEGATKRNKPALQLGMLLYARISTVYRRGIMDPVLSCQIGPRDAGASRKDWMTNEGTYGELKGGTVQRVSLGLARELLQPNNVVLTELANHKIAFELAVGVNGLLWVHSTHPQYTTLIQNAIQNSEVLTEPHVRGMVKSLFYTVQKQMQQDADHD